MSLRLFCRINDQNRLSGERGDLVCKRVHFIDFFIDFSLISDFEGKIDEIEV